MKFGIMEFSFCN